MIFPLKVSCRYSVAHSLEIILYATISFQRELCYTDKQIAPSKPRFFVHSKSLSLVTPQQLNTVHITSIMPGLNIDTSFQADPSLYTMSPSYEWSFISSSQPEQNSTTLLDLLFDSSTPLSSPREVQYDSHIGEEISNNLLPWPVPQVDIAEDFVSSYASSAKSDDYHAPVGDVKPIPAPAMTQDCLTGNTNVDRKCRRREQNRKAQCNFRLKRKEEVRRLEREVRELRAQVADFHRRAPTANLTICTSCRMFYPAKTAEAAAHFAAKPSLFG
jgi:hypothetical protein